jgi:DNA topoisomerase-2
MHAFNSKNKIQKYTSFFELLEEFCTYRLELYKQRKETLLKVFKEKLPFHENVVRFIKQQSFDMPIPDLKRKTYEECLQLLEEQQFTKIDGYDYLLDLPFKSITIQNIKKHTDELQSLKKKIETLEKKTIETLWLDDLETFHSIYLNGKDIS